MNAPRIPALAALLFTTALTAPGLAMAQTSPTAPTTPPEAGPSPVTGPTSEASEEGQPTEVDEIVVVGRYIPDERRVTSEISNVISVEDFARTGDSEVGDALARVPGLSVVGDGFVYVRGLGERYSSALLDGAQLPSPTPLRRVVPLDLFPTALLSGALVQKTYSVQYPAEFGGGLIELRTRAVPQEDFLEMSISAGWNSESTLDEGLGWDAGDAAIVGINDGALDLPDEIKAAPSLVSFTPEQRAAAGRSLRNVWNLSLNDNPFDTGVSVAGGKAFDLANGWRLGILAAGNYDSEFRNQRGVRNTYITSAGGILPNDQIDPAACGDFDGIDADSCGVFRTDWQVSLNAIGSIGLELSEDDTVKYTTLLLRRTTRQGLVEQGSFAADPGVLRQFNRLNWVEQQVWSNQVSGEHRRDLTIGLGGLGDLTEANLDWRLSYSQAQRDTPYRREYSYLYESDNVFRLSSRYQNRTIFSALEDQNLEAGFDADLEGTIFGRESTLRFGGMYLDKQRDFAQRRYGFTFPAGALLDLRAQDPETIFAPGNISPTGFQLSDFTDPTDFFDAGIEIFAGYASGEMQLTDRLRWTAGVRYEDSSQYVATVDPTTDIGFTRTQDAWYVLPATTLTWEFADNMQARLGYSRTLSRPDLRELSNAEFLDEETDQLERGNPNLQITEIDNFDARWEWYFASRQSATIGAFYKSFDKPIERTFSLLGEDPIRSFANADSATLYGAEAEIDWTVPIDVWMADNAFFADRRWFVVANLTYINAEIELDPTTAGQQTDINRPLQGQSEWLGNLQLGWESPELMERAALVLNYQGERIFDVGLFGVPNVIETPPVLLDLVVAKGFTVGEDEVEVELQVENILGEGYELTQAGLIAENYDYGTTVSLSLKGRF